MVTKVPRCLRPFEVAIFGDVATFEDGHILEGAQVNTKMVR
jgi:hypothetical protein